MVRADSHDFVKIGAQRHSLFAPASDNIGFDRDEGHVFDNLPEVRGVIGPRLTEDERWAIIEYLKQLPPLPAGP